MDENVFPFRQPPLREDALAKVREIAKESGRIYWTDHAGERMEEREISSRQALRTIQEGQIDGKIVSDGRDEWKLTLKKRDAGQTVRVVVAMSGSGDLTVVTVV